MISQKFLDRLDKNKFYCYYCAENNIIKELNVGENSLIVTCEEHAYKKSNFYSIYFNRNLNKWCKKRCNIDKVFELTTIEEDQEKELNSRYIHINIKNLPEDIKIQNSENGLFYISNLLDNDYISVHKNTYSCRQVDLIRKCKNCNKEFKINDISRIEESFCCSVSCYREFENKSRENSIKYGNDYLSENFLDKLDKSKVYCYYCARLNIVNELEFDSKNNQYIPCGNHRGSNFLMLVFINNDWYIIHGIKITGQKNKITTLENRQKYILENSFTNVRVEDIPSYVFYREINDDNGYGNGSKEDKIYYLSKLLNEDWICTISNNYTYKRINLFGKCMNSECNNIIPYNLDFDKTNLCNKCKENEGNYLLKCFACGENFISKGTVHNNCKNCENELNNFIKSENKSGNENANDLVKDILNGVKNIDSNEK